MCCMNKLDLIKILYKFFSPNCTFVYIRVFPSHTVCEPMLRDITTTSAKVNSAIVPRIRKHNNAQKSKSNKKRVQFDADGMGTHRLC